MTSNSNSFFAGFCGGIIGTVLSHPIDTARILKQTAKPIILKNLYKGISAPLIGVGLEKAIVFGTFDNLHNSNINDFSKGIISGLASTVIVTPMEKIKINLQTQNHKNITLKHIYSGCAATFLREVPGYGIYFSVYGSIKKESDTNVDTFMKGGLSGCVSWAFIYPADYVKTLVQHKNISYSSAINQVIKSKNPFVLYSGFSLALLRCFPLHGGVFLGYKLCN